MPASTGPSTPQKGSRWSTGASFRTCAAGRILEVFRTSGFYFVDIRSYKNRVRNNNKSSPCSTCYKHSIRLSPKPDSSCHGSSISGTRPSLAELSEEYKTRVAATFCLDLALKRLFASSWFWRCCGWPSDSVSGGGDARDLKLSRQTMFGYRSESVLEDGAGFSSASEREDFDCPRRYDVEGEGHGFEAPSARVQRALRGCFSS